MSRRWDSFVVRLANAVLRMASRQYRDRLSTLLEQGMRYRAPAPQVSEQFKSRSAGAEEKR